MMKYIGASALAFSIVLASPAEAKKKPEMTPMELQALQSKEFETKKETLFACVMSVFQDLGYQVDSADMQTGFISASSASGNKTNFGEALFGVSSSGNTRATAFVEQMPNGMARVRLNFLNTKISSSLYGQSAKQDKPVLDVATYQAAWEKIDEALFVRTAVTETTHPVAAGQEGGSVPASAPADASPVAAVSPPK